MSLADVRQHIARKRATFEAGSSRPSKKSKVVVSVQAPAAASTQAPAVASTQARAAASTMIEEPEIPLVFKPVLALSAPTALLTVPSTDGVVREGTAIAESVAPSSEKIRAEVEVAAKPEQSMAASIAPLAGVSLTQSSSDRKSVV